jgi:fructose-1-phosphate kinase PfkB-like protein
MIRTITLNTGFDEVFTVSGISFGGVERVLDHSELAAGKGINAARRTGTCSARRSSRRA